MRRVVRVLGEATLEMEKYQCLWDGLCWPKFYLVVCLQVASMMINAECKMLGMLISFLVIKCSIVNPNPIKEKKWDQ